VAAREPDLVAKVKKGYKIVQVHLDGFNLLALTYAEICPMRHRAVVVAVILVHGTVHSVNSEPASSNLLSPTRIYRVASPLTDDEGDVATNISGLACKQTAAGSSKCLVIDDEGRSAQVATIGDGVITAGPRLSLVGKKPSNDTIGQPPGRIGCSGGEGRFKDMDGEAVAYASPYFYVVGSHGCSRHSDKFHSSAFILARIPEAQVTGASSGQASMFGSAGVLTTYRLSEALAVAPKVRRYFTMDLMSDNGLNIEGLVVTGGKLFAGLRAPTLDGKSFVVAIDAERLFNANAAIDESDVRIISVPLGPGRGIRDLALLNDGRLLVLSGPAQDVQVPFEIHVFDPVSEASVLLGTLRELPEAGEAKAEAISVLSQHENILDVLVLFDGLENGGPREYRILLK
jgi:hypothetical protein